MINVVTSSRYTIDRKKIRQLVNEYLTQKSISNEYVLNVVFVGKNKMKTVTATYKHENHALPVLSFPYKNEKSEDRYISAICDIYVDKYPEGKYKDIFQWLSFYFTNKPYEIEGSAGVAIAQAELYDKYLSEHKESKASDEIKLKIAESCVIAYECLENGESEGFPEEKGNDFLKKATDLYRELLKDNDLKIRETARIGLYNIEQNKRIYFNANGWHQYQ